MCVQFLKHEKKQMMMERIKWNFEKVRTMCCSMVDRPLIMDYGT